LPKWNVRTQWNALAITVISNKWGNEYCCMWPLHETYFDLAPNLTNFYSLNTCSQHTKLCRSSGSFNFSSRSPKSSSVSAWSSDDGCVATGSMRLRLIDCTSFCSSESRYKTLFWKPAMNNINWRDVQTKNVVNNVDMSCLRAPWQNGPYIN